MKPEYTVYVLTALAAVVVVLTRVRLSQAQAAGHLQVGNGPVNVHSVCGVIALLCWVPYLVSGQELLGIIGLGFWWVTAVAGLLVLLRWLPTRGRHASDTTEDSWSEGPGLSILAHVGLLVGVGVFTWFYIFTP